MWFSDECETACTQSNEIWSVLNENNLNMKSVSSDECFLSSNNGNGSLGMVLVYQFASCALRKHRWACIWSTHTPSQFRLRHDNYAVHHLALVHTEYFSRNIFLKKNFLLRFCSPVTPFFSYRCKLFPMKTIFLFGKEDMRSGNMPCCAPFRHS